MRTGIFALALPLLATACAGKSMASGALIGRWDLTAREERPGEVSRPRLRLMLFITALRGDSVFGEATVYLDATEPLDDRPCAKLAGIAPNDSHINLTIFTTDEPAADMILDAQMRDERIIVGSFRPRDGHNVLPPGSRLILDRQSKDPRRVGCLTSAWS